MKADRLGVLEEILLATETDRYGAVLDVGCGNGEKSFFLAKKVKKVVGIDPEHKAIERARKKYKKENLYFEVCRGEALSFSSLSFDLVLFCQSLHHVHIKLQSIALNEARRVLSPHGHMIIIEPVYNKGAFEEIVSLYNDEKETRKNAQKKVKSLINNEFSLLFEKKIRIENTCEGFDDLYHNNIMTKSYANWQESYKRKIESILANCNVTQNGEIILDYYATIWFLKKRESVSLL